MRRAVPALVGLALVALLSACSPGKNSTVAIGLDNQGQLIGAVKVCDHSVVRAALSGGGVTVNWGRTSPLTDGVETWRLEGGAGGRWETVTPPPRTLAPETTYQFYGEDADVSYRSHILEFRGSDLARLRPGELLVDHPGPADEKGNPTFELTVISVEDLSQESCPA